MYLQNHISNSSYVLSRGGDNVKLFAITESAAWTSYNPVAHKHSPLCQIASNLYVHIFLWWHIDLPEVLLVLLYAVLTLREISV